MPGADSSQYIEFKKRAAAARKPTAERNNQPVAQVTGAKEMTKFLPSLTIKNTSTVNQYFPINVGVPTNKVKNIETPSSFSRF